MQIILSPSKSMKFNNNRKAMDFSHPKFLKQSEKLVTALKKYPPDHLRQLMGISDKLAELNFTRFQQWTENHQFPKAKPAVLVFSGDVYTGLDAGSFSDDDLAFAQKHLSILSGLYGLLNPLDLIMPYRLEMGTKLSIGKTKDLYDFWNDKLTKYLQEKMNQNKDGYLVNLASKEYFKALNLKKLDKKVVTPVFKEFKNGKMRFISFNAKKARGMMARFIIQNKLHNIDELKLFKEEGYYFDENQSTTNDWLFVR